MHLGQSLARERSASPVDDRCIAAVVRDAGIAAVSLCKCRLRLEQENTNY
jgi:hypothetical protein